MVQRVLESFEPKIVWEIFDIWAESLAKLWYTEKSSGESKFMVKGEGDAYAQFMNTSELNLLVGYRSISLRLNLISIRWFTFYN